MAVGTHPQTLFQVNVFGDYEKSGPVDTSRFLRSYNALTDLPGHAKRLAKAKLKQEHPDARPSRYEVNTITRDGLIEN